MIKEKIYKLLSFLKKVGDHDLKIEGAEEDDVTGLICLVLSIDGKCTPPIKREPYELLKEIGPKKVFSESDFKLIIHYMLENQKRITERKHEKIYKLIKHQFSEQLEEPLVVFKNIKSNKIYIKAAKEIYSDADSIKKFSSEDSICIGNIVGYFEAEKEFKLRQHQNSKNNNVIKFDTSLISG